VSIYNGDLDAFKRHMDLLDGESTMVLGGIPPIVLAAHCNQLGIVEWLVTSNHCDSSLSEAERSVIKDSCAARDGREVRQIINDLFGQGIRRCKMMQSFLRNDVNAARNTLLKHYQKVTIKRKEAPTFKQLIEATPVVLLPDDATEEERSASIEMHLAANSDDVYRMQRALKAVLTAKGSVDCVDKTHTTPLMIAAKCGSDKLVKALVKHRANPQQTNLYRYVRAPARFNAVRLPCVHQLTLLCVLLPLVLPQ